MKKIIFVIVVFAIIGLGIYAIFNVMQKPKIDSQKITVVATLFPQYDFVKAIGGDKVDVALLLPPGVEAHAYEPKPSDIAKINAADIFIYTGEFMEPWAHDIVKSMDSDVKVIDASIGVSLIKIDDPKHQHQNGEDNEHGYEDEYDKADQHDSDEDSHHHGGVDPHIWLDFENAQIIAGRIANTLAEIDQRNAQYYQNNFDNYQTKLVDLDEAYKNTLFVCQSRTIIYGGHYAFGYLAKRYGLDYASAQGFSPDSEPTAKDMIELVEQIKRDNISYIFYEELTSPKIAETLAKETSVEMLLLNGAHNLSKEDYQSGATFISLMKENLNNLSLGLNCQNNINN